MKVFNISVQAQCWLYHFAWLLNVLGMVLTDLWLPMVVGTVVTTYLSLDAWVRWKYVLPLKQQITVLQAEVNQLRRKELDQ